MESVASPRRTISGKSFTIAFSILIVLGVALGFSLALRFQAIMDSLDAVRLDWPNASLAIEEYYQLVDTKMAASSDQTQQKKWDTLRSQFKESSRFDSQSVYVSELNRLSAEADVAGEMPLKVESVAKFLDSDRKLDSLRSDFLGRLTMTLLRLKIPNSVYRSFPNKP